MSGATPKRGSQGRRARSTKKSRSTFTPSGKINMPSNPPQITYQPWYHLVLAIPHTGESAFTPKGLVGHIRDQLDPHSHGFIPTKYDEALSFRLQFRVHSVRSWNLTGRTIALAVDDFSVRNKSDQEQVCGLVDSGTALHVPAVGYRLSHSLSEIVLRNDSDDKDDVILHIMAPAGNSCMTYIEISWRFDGPIKVPQFRSNMEKLLGHVNFIKGTQVKMEREVSHISGIMDEQIKNGYIDTIVNGISKTADVVIPVLADEDRAAIVKLAKQLELLVLNSSLRPASEGSFSLVEDRQDDEPDETT